MCVVNSDKSKYELILFDSLDNYICTIPFASITTVCRFLEDADLSNCHIDIFRRSDNKVIDLEILMSIWQSDFYDCEV